MVSPGLIQTQKRMLRRSRRNTRRSKASVRPLYPNIMVLVAEVVLAVPVEKRRRRRHTMSFKECPRNRRCRCWRSDVCQGLLQVFSPLVSPPWQLQQPFLPPPPTYARLLLLQLPSIFTDKACVCPTFHQMQKARFPRQRTEDRVTAKTEEAVLGHSIQKRERSPRE